MDETATIEDLQRRLAETERRLRERDEELKKHRSLLDAIDTGFCIIEMLFDESAQPVDYVFHETNAAFAEQTGLSDAVGKRVRDLAPDHERFWFETYGRIARSGRAERFEHRADALDRWYEVYAFRVGAPAQNRVAILFADVKERRLAENRLRESEERFRAFVTASSDIIYRMSADWSELRELDGRGFVADTSSASAEWLQRYIYPADQPKVVAAIGAAVLNRSVFNLEHRVMGAEGDIRWVSSRAVPILDDGGKLREWIGTATDVTDRKAADEALKESEERYRTFVQASNQVLYRHNPDWTEMRQLSGGGFLADTEAPDPNWFDLYIPLEDQPHVRSVIAKAIDAKGVFELEHRVRRADGAVGWTLSRSVPVLDERDEILGWFGAASDVTARREAEEALRESAGRMEILVAELQHRTRNVLTVVQALFRQSAAASPDLSDLRERFDARLGALSRVNSLLSHLDGLERVSFDVLVEEEVMAIAGEERRGQIRLEGPRGIKLRSSSLQTFALGLHELATNAVKHGALSRPDGRLAVTWRSSRDEGEARWLHIEWRETGVSIPLPASDGSSTRRGGAGRKLIERALPYQLGAKVEYDLAGDGLICRISLPASQER